MALILHSSSIYTTPTTTKPRLPLLLSKPTQFSPIKSQDSSSTQPKEEISKKPNNTNSGTTGLGFGSSTSTVKKKPQNGKRERASVIRRTPVQKPNFASGNEEVQTKELRKNESAFLLAWLGLGVIILVQGIALAASGFLPEEWDSFFVKYLYPSFTPTVFLFVAGTVAYGVLKYLQNENFNKEN